MEKRTGRQGQSESQIVGEEKRNGRLVAAAETSKERAEWRRLQQKNLSILGLQKRKELPQCHRESSWSVRQSRLFQKGKEQSRLSRTPDRKENIRCQRSKEEQEQSKEKETSILVQKDNESGSDKQSHPNELSKNSRKGDVRWGERSEKEGRLVESVGGQKTSSEAPTRSKLGRERKEQRRCQGSSDCRGSNEEE